jgi:hypothetical protein
MRVVVVALALVVSCVAIAGDRAASRKPAAAARPSSPIAAAWVKLPTKGSACADVDLGFDYGIEGGMRNFYCRARQVLPWKTFRDVAPTIFRAGPHAKDGALELHSERDFGRYDPAFVRWANEHLIPAASDDTLRAATQGIYDAQVKSLAHAYHLVDLVMTANPAWITRERQVYPAVDATGAVTVTDVYAATEPYYDLLGSADHNWGGFDPNVVRGATMWWLRRHEDGTAALWRQGLTKLLVTYDAAWLKATKAPKTARLPQRLDR